MPVVDFWSCFSSRRKAVKLLTSDNSKLSFRTFYDPHLILSSIFQTLYLNKRNKTGPKNELKGKSTQFKHRKGPELNDHNKT